MNSRLPLAFCSIALSLVAGVASAGDAAKGYFHFGRTKFDVVDAVAFVQTEGFPEPATMIAMADFPIDRQELAASIDPMEGPFWQAVKNERGNFVFVIPTAADRCKVIAVLNAGQNHIELSETPGKTKTAGPARVEGTCFTAEPGKMFDDAYDYRLPYSLAITPITKPLKLGTGGGEPGRALVSLIGAIQANDWNTAAPHLRESQASAKPKPEEMKDFFHGLALNYPKKATATGGLMKGDRARVEIKGVDLEGKSIEGYFTMRKAGTDWRVVEQFLHYAY